MSRSLRTLVAVLALAALVSGALGGCACAMPSVPAAAHDCCDRSGPALTVSHDCCGSGTATAAPVLVVAALHASPAPVADALLVAAVAPAGRMPAAPLALSSAPPLILRI